jgi:hypothetical protein
LSFTIVKVLFVAVAYFCLVASVWFWLRSFDSDQSVLATAAASVLFVGSYAGVVVVQVQQLAVVILAAVGGAMMAIAAGRLGLAGVLLALATIKPQSVLPIVAWLLIWAISNWKDRRDLLISFSITSVALLAGAEALLPGWIWEWRRALSAYMRYAPIGGAYVELLFGSAFGKVVAGLLILGICMFCWRARQDDAQTDRFKLTIPLILTSNLLVNPVWHTYDHIFVLPAALLLFHWRDEFLRLRPLGRAVAGLCAIAVFWQWAAAAAVSFIGVVSRKSAWNLQIVPWLSIFFTAPLLFVSLFLMGRTRLARLSPRNRLEPTPLGYPSGAIDLHRVSAFPTSRRGSQFAGLHGTGTFGLVVVPPMADTVCPNTDLRSLHQDQSGERIGRLGTT